MKKENLDLLTSSKESIKKTEAIKKYEEFKKYCINDVRVERSIRKVLEKVKLPESEQKLWELDQEINDRGVLVDTNLLKNAIYYDNIFKSNLIEKLKKLMGKSERERERERERDYLKSLGVEVNSLSKESVCDLLNSYEVQKNPNYEKIKEVLDLRAMLNKTSTKKYEAMERCMCDDERIRGLFQFYGANRTGRWAGRLVQVQNLPQNKMSNLEEVREKIRNEINTNFPSRKKILIIISI